MLGYSSDDFEYGGGHSDVDDDDHEDIFKICAAIAAAPPQSAHDDGTEQPGQPVDLEDLIENTPFPDCNLLIGDDTFCAHRLVLSLYS
jgi:hypothetical protein